MRATTLGDLAQLAIGNVTRIRPARRHRAHAVIAAATVIDFLDKDGLRAIAAQADDVAINDAAGVAITATIVIGPVVIASAAIVIAAIAEAQRNRELRVGAIITILRIIAVIVAIVIAVIVIKRAARRAIA